GAWARARHGARAAPIAAAAVFTKSRRVLTAASRSSSLRPGHLIPAASSRQGTSRRAPAYHPLTGRERVRGPRKEWADARNAAGAGHDRGGAADPGPGRREGGPGAALPALQDPRLRAAAGDGNP